MKKLKVSLLIMSPLNLPKGDLLCCFYKYLPHQRIGVLYLNSESFNGDLWRQGEFLETSVDNIGTIWRHSIWIYLSPGTHPFQILCWLHLTGAVFPLSFPKRGADVFVIDAVIPLSFEREGDRGGEFRGLSGWDTHNHKVFNISPWRYWSYWRKYLHDLHALHG